MVCRTTPIIFRLDGIEMMNNLIRFDLKNIFLVIKTKKITRFNLIVQRLASNATSASNAAIVSSFSI
jgi:hypothetical protein